MSRAAAIAVLLLATAIWGFAFAAQKSAMAHMGPLTFAGVRYLIGGLAALPFGLAELRRAGPRLASVPRRYWGYLALLSLVFFAASWLQQAGLQHTTVTNGGFLTSLYVLFVPVIVLVATGVRPHPIVVLAAPLAVIGIYLLNGASLDALNLGDAMMVVGAVLWALHVILVGVMARGTGLPVMVSAVSFLVVGALALAFAFLLETPTLPAIAAGWVELLYAGILSTAIAYSLQAVGQQHVPASNAAIILSSESLFAALAGALLMDERLLPIGYAGAALIFVAIILVEIVPLLRRRPRPQSAS